MTISRQYRFALLVALLSIVPACAWADAMSDCSASRDHDMVIRGCTELIAKNPTDANPYYNRGTAYLSRGLLDLAIADFDWAIQRNPKDAEPYNNRGNAYMRKEQYERALKDYARAIEMYRQVLRQAVEFVQAGERWLKQGAIVAVGAGRDQMQGDAGGLSHDRALEPLLAAIHW